MAAKAPEQSLGFEVMVWTLDMLFGLIMTQSIISKTLIMDMAQTFPYCVCCGNANTWAILLTLVNFNPYMDK